MITRIKLTNWKSHLESEVSFSKGVNALIGIMGSGKTSVMQAIAFALFGTFSALGSKKLSLDDLIMGKPHRKDSASVELDFIAEGKTYTVKRTIERAKGTTSAEIRENGKLLEVNPQGVTREVGRILQMDYDLFQRAVYSEQNALDYFLQIPKGRRMQQIDEMLKLDRYEKARESAVYIRNRIFERRKEMMRVVEDMKLRRLEDKVTELGKEIKSMEREKYGVEEEMAKVEKERRKLSEGVVKYEASHDLLNETAKKSESLASRASEMKRHIDSRKLKMKGTKISAEILKRMAGDILKLEVKLEEKGIETRMLRDSVSSKNSRMLFLRDQSKEAKLRLSASKENELKLRRLEKLLGEDPDKKTGEMLENLEQLKKKLYSLTAEKNEMEKSLKELKDAGERCPVCESRLTEERKKDLVGRRMKHMGSFDMTIREAKERLAKETAMTEEFRKSVLEYAGLKRDLKDLDSAKERITDNEDKMTALAKVVKGIVSEIQKKEEDEKGLRLLIEKTRLRKGKAEDMLKEKEEFDKLVKERKELTRHLRGLGKQIKTLEKKLKGKDIRSMRAALQEAVGKSRSMETKLKDMLEMLKDKKSAFRDMEEQAETLARYRNDAERYGKITDSMDVFVSILRGTQDQLRDEFLKTVNQIMNGIWDELYPYGDFSEIRLLVDKDYVLQLKSAKEWMNVDSVSGGERSLAFTPNLRWLILDEPTHNLDANAIEHFGSVLKDRMESIVDQVFLITHEERLSDYITGLTYRLERDKESDGVTKVIEI